MGGAAHEVAATLNALEEKLRELERELLGGGAAAASPPPHGETPSSPPHPPPPAPSQPPPAPPQLDPLDELVAFRDLLERSADTLIAEYEQLLGRLRAGPLGTATPPEQSFQGHATIEAGPFPDVAALLAFESGVRAIPGARDARVSNYDGRTAVVHAVLDQPVGLVTELRRFSPLPFKVVAEHPGVLSLRISSGE